MEEIYKRLKQLRKERGVSLNSLAEKMGVDYQQLSRIERGKSRLNINVLMKLADALDTPISEIVDSNLEGGQKPPPKEHYSTPATPSQNLLATILEKIDTILEETQITLRPQTKAALATQIYHQAIYLQSPHHSADDIIAFSMDLIKVILADKTLYLTRGEKHIP